MGENQKQENKNLDILQRAVQVPSIYLGLPLLPQKCFLFLLLLLSLEVVLGGCRGVGADLEEVLRFPVLPLLPCPLLLPLCADGNLAHLARGPSQPGALVTLLTVQPTT